MKTKKQLHREKQLKSNTFKKTKNEQRKDVLPKSVKAKKKKTNGLVTAEKELNFKASDMMDMLNSDSESDHEVDIPASKRQKIDHSDDELSFEGDSDHESDNSELGDEELEQIELKQKKSSRDEALNNKRVKELLPIKTKGGLLMTRTTEEPKEHSLIIDEKQMDIDDNDDASERVEKTSQGSFKQKKIFSATELLRERQKELEGKKFQIGKFCSGITENPEDKVGNLKTLLEFLQDTDADEKRNLLSVRKLTMFSLTEVFKDITPDYKIGIVDLENQKVKKDTLARVTFENELLKYYKNFLRELENISKALKPGKYSKRPSKESINLAESAIYCLCEILQTHPYFNFNTNIAQLLVTYLNCFNSYCRKLINETFIKIFKTDKRLDLTLHVI